MIKPVFRCWLPMIGALFVAGLQYAPVPTIDVRGPLTEKAARQAILKLGKYKHAPIVFSLPNPPNAERAGCWYCDLKNKRFWMTLAEYTDPLHNPMIPHVIALEPGLVIYKIYNGNPTLNYWLTAGCGGRTQTDRARQGSSGTIGPARPPRLNVAVDSQRTPSRRQLSRVRNPPASQCTASSMSCSTRRTLRWIPPSGGQP
jgi:hypothetical protein